MMQPLGHLVPLPQFKPRKTGFRGMGWIPLEKDPKRKRRKRRCLRPCTKLRGPHIAAEWIEDGTVQRVYKIVPELAKRCLKHKLDDALVLWLNLRAWDDNRGGNWTLDDVLHRARYCLRRKNGVLLDRTLKAIIKKGEWLFWEQTVRKHKLGKVPKGTPQLLLRSEASVCNALLPANPQNGQKYALTHEWRPLRELCVCVAERRAVLNRIVLEQPGRALTAQQVANRTGVTRGTVQNRKNLVHLDQSPTWNVVYSCEGDDRLKVWEKACREQRFREYVDGIPVFIFRDAESYLYTYHLARRGPNIYRSTALRQSTKTAHRLNRKLRSGEYGYAGTRNTFARERRRLLNDCGSAPPTPYHARVNVCWDTCLGSPRTVFWQPSNGVECVK